MNGKQQEGFVKGVPRRVEFGVCILLFYLNLAFVCNTYIFTQICTHFQNERIEFVRLEELQAPSFGGRKEGKGIRF